MNMNARNAAATFCHGAIWHLVKENPEREGRDGSFRSLSGVQGASIYDVRKILGFFDPIRPVTQPPLLRLLTMSAFGGTPLPPQCGSHTVDIA